MQRPFDIQEFLANALAEDIGHGDLTTDAVIPPTAQSRLVMRAREPLVVAGASFLPLLFSLLDSAVQVELFAEDGAHVPQGATLAELRGPARALLMGERVALNLVQQLSGVATLTRRYVEAVAGTRVRVADTRKTVPGLRSLQKYAVRCGGGTNHRMGLYDGVMIKDNHIAIAGSVTAAVLAAKDATPLLTRIEVECDTLAQVEEALAAGADMLLLDNMEEATLHEAVCMAQQAGVLTEASGNVSLDRIATIAHSGVDVISIGRLTHSAPAVDIGLDAG